MRFFLIAVLFFVMPSMTRADEVWLEYIDWITENSDFEYNGEELPTLERYDQAMLQILIYGPDAVAQAEFRGDSLPPVEGGYDHRVNTMYLRTDPVSDDMETATIVHELVHFLQTVNGQEFECNGMAEMPAYRLHWQYAQEHNLDVPEPSWLYVILLEQSCHRREW